LSNHNSKRKAMYRSKEEMTRQWQEKGGKPDKADWFRKSGATGVFNVPATEGSKLAAVVRTVLDTVPGPKDSKIVVQERPGSSVRQNLVTSRCFPRASCNRPFCPWVINGENCYEACYTESVGYVARCRRCRTEQLQAGKEETEVVDVVYIGESSRSLPTRSSLHFRDYRQDIKKKRGKTDEAIPVGRKQNRTRLTSEGEEEGGGEGGERGEGGGGGGEGGVSSWMADHSRSTHNSVISLDFTEDYEFSVTGRFQKPLHRQVVEYLNITKAEQEGKVKINTKITWKVSKELMNRQDENWSWGQKTKLTAGQKSWGR
jgi:hypothetical protein